MGLAGEVERKRFAYVNGYQGFGDQFYIRPTVAALSRLYERVDVVTAIPQAFAGIENVRFLVPRKPIHLRFQDAENAKRREDPNTVDRVPIDGLPADTDHFAPRYDLKRDCGKHGLTLWESVAKSCGVLDEIFAEDAVIGEADRPILADTSLLGRFILVCPPVIRKEWKAPSRLPDTELFLSVLALLKTEHPDCRTLMLWPSGCDGAEKIYPFDLAVDLWNGRSNVCMDDIVISRSFLDALGILRAADAVLTSVKWTVPASIALGIRKLSVVFGGSVPPKHLIGTSTFNPVVLSESVVAYAPKGFCACFESNHECYGRVFNDPFKHGA